MGIRHIPGQKEKVGESNPKEEDTCGGCVNRDKAAKENKLQGNIMRMYVCGKLPS